MPARTGATLVVVELGSAVALCVGVGSGRGVSEGQQAATRLALSRPHIGSEAKEESWEVLFFACVD